MKILLTGKNGQVGFELQRALAPLGQVLAVGSDDCDLSDAQALRDLVRSFDPQVIVNTAAYTAVDKAESEPERAFALNAVAPGLLGEAAQATGATVLHFSTDYVFDGTKSGAYSEADTPNPLSVYGKSKLDGEQRLARATPRHLIMRTSWVMGGHGSNFAKTILRKAAECDELRVVDDQVGAPTSAALLADLTAHLVRQLHRGPGPFPFGTYHVSASGETSWHALAQYVIQQATDAGHVLKATPASVRPIASRDFAAAAPRPANSRLDTSRFQRSFDLQLPHWQHGIQRVLQHIL
jgi:dTDP-4-dehydrorhamnose reductase